MSDIKTLHPYCDVCGKELSAEDKSKNIEFENYEFPFCDDCFQEFIKKIDYIISKSK